MFNRIEGTWPTARSASMREPGAVFTRHPNVSAYAVAAKCVIVSAIGEFDLGTRDRLVATLRAQPWATARAVVVDLTHVTFCDAHVAGALIALGERAGEHDVPVHVVVRSSIVLRCFTALGVTSALPTHGTVAAAMTAAGCRRAS